MVMCLSAEGEVTGLLGRIREGPGKAESYPSIGEFWEIRRKAAFGDVVMVLGLWASTNGQLASLTF